MEFVALAAMSWPTACFYYNSVSPDLEHSYKCINAIKVVSDIYIIFMYKLVYSDKDLSILLHKMVKICNY